MKHAENGSLLDYVSKQKKHLSEKEACMFFQQIVSAVTHIHKIGICHRDIKCENILLDKNNVIKLIDFGFSKILNLNQFEEQIGGVKVMSLEYGAQDSQNCNLSSTFCGSFAYASPEILKGIPYDPRTADIWAMGVVLYFMVFGVLPFQDLDIRKLRRAVWAPLRFPIKPKATNECRRLLRNILAPLKDRLNLNEIKMDYWIYKTKYVTK